MFKKKFVNFHEILIWASLRSLNFIIVDWLQAILLYNIQKLFLKSYNFSNHLTILFKNEVLLNLIFFILLIGHSVCYIYIYLILDFVLNLRQLPLKHIHSLLI